MVHRLPVCALVSGVSLLSACSGGDGEQPLPGLEGPADTGELVQEWSEPFCGRVFPDATLLPGPENIITSPASYGTRSCTDAYVVDVKPGRGTHTVRIAYGGVVPDDVVFPCDVAWLRVQVWKRKIGSGQLGFSKVSETPFVHAAARVPGACHVPSFYLDTSSPDMEYRLVAQAGFIFTLQPVTATAFDFD